MKILFFNYEYPPLGGGAGNATKYILAEYAKIPGLEVDLITSSLDSEYHLEKAGENISIHKLPIGKNAENLHYQTERDLLVYSWRAFWFAKKLIKKNKYDLAHAFFGIPCGFLAMLLRVPYIVSLRGSDVPFYNNRFYVLDNLILKRLSKLVWKKAKAVVSLSYDLIELARRTSKTQQISVIYNGINVDEFHPDPELLSKEKYFNILFVGRLIERKGLLYLLEAFRGIYKDNRNIRLHVAGGGPLIEEHKKYAEENKIADAVIFHGIVDHDEVSKLYMKSHVFVLPSLNEALGNVTQEALACGLPIITTKTGAAELIKDNGYVIQKKSAEDIENALRELIKDEDNRKMMSQKSRELALEMSWENTARKYYEIYKKLI